ncbi:PREDICTED: GTPase IMAP family member 8-like, partial [Cyprinodon variegatus]|uniref:GTPase IMAP family member 8-like n=1 Tax=Cyprinodon variegatus TaxID=28743 RepID=UPI000742CADA
MEDIDLLELLTRFGQIVKENSGEYVTYEEVKDAATTLEDSHQSQKEKAAMGSIAAGVQAAGIGAQVPRTHLSYEASGFRIVLLGKSEQKKINICNLITGEQELHQQKHRVAYRGNWSGKPVTVVKTPDMFSLSKEKIQEEVKNCVRLCSPGPNVLLLLVKPSEFKEKDREKLMFILSLFGQDAFKYSIVILTNDSKNSQSTNILIKMVQGRFQNMRNIDQSQLMKQVETVVTENKGAYLTFREETSRPQDEQMQSLINLVLCGRRGSGKTSAAKAILGQTDLLSPSNSECVRHQGEVCGRWVSVVELPALCGKPQQEVMEESFRCISLCDPEGVHTFILVLPAGPLTDEDKGELQTIQDTFSSRVNDFTIILFTKKSDPTAGDVNFIETDRNIQELLQSCGGRYVVLNINDEQWIHQLLDRVENIKAAEDKPKGYNFKTFAHAQISRLIQKEAHNSKQQEQQKNKNI